MLDRVLVHIQDSNHLPPSKWKLWILKWPDGFVLKERDVLGLTERTDIWINTICLQRRFRLTGLQMCQTTSPVRINKKPHSFHQHRLCYMLHECYIIETCSRISWCSLGTTCSHVLPHPAIYGSWVFIDCWIFTAAGKLLLLSSPVCIVTFVSSWNSNLQRRTKRDAPFGVLKTSQTEVNLSRSTPKLQVQHQFAIYSYLLHEHIQSADAEIHQKKWITPYKRISRDWYWKATPATATEKSGS
jgi:hypothetical protein